MEGLDPLLSQKLNLRPLPPRPHSDTHDYHEYYVVEVRVYLCESGCHITLEFNGKSEVCRAYVIGVTSLNPLKTHD